MGRRTVAERRVVPVGELCIMQIARVDRARGFLLRQRIKKSSGREKSDPPLGSSRLAPSRGEHQLTLQKMQIHARAQWTIRIICGTGIGGALKSGKRAYDVASRDMLIRA